MTTSRLLLFDIDGTLLSGGPAKDAFHEALLDVFGTAGPIESWEFSGKTDPQIARELLVQAGLDDAAIDEGFPSLWHRYIVGLEGMVPDRPFRSLAGVPEVLARLARESWAHLGLLTGNLVDGARVKLASAGLDVSLDVGAFGSDHEERNKLPPVALDRARARWERDFAPDDVVIIGDTPRDVECGRAHGLQTLGVATGRFSIDELQEAGAHAVLEDLSDAEAVLRCLNSNTQESDRG